MSVLFGMYQPEKGVIDVYKRQALHGMFGSTGCGANGMYFPAMSFWPGMWRRAARALSLIHISSA